MPFYLLPGGRPGSFFHIPQQNTRHNTSTASLKGLVRCKTAVKALIDETLNLSVAFDVFRTATDKMLFDLEMGYRQLPESDNSHK